MANSPAQKASYDIVLEAQHAAMDQAAPGRPWILGHEAAVEVLTEGLLSLGLLKGSLKSALQSGAYRRFYMHKTGHWIGLDVHDVGEYKVAGEFRELEPGMVFTIEPGLYIPPGSKGVPAKWQGIGIRIEDDVAITKDGHEVLTGGVPRSPVVWISAPMARSGLAMRSIGRLVSDGSPVITVSNGCADRMPDRIASSGRWKSRSSQLWTNLSEGCVTHAGRPGI